MDIFMTSLVNHMAHCWDEILLLFLFPWLKGIRVV